VARKWRDPGAAVLGAGGVARAAGDPVRGARGGGGGGSGGGGAVREGGDGADAGGADGDGAGAAGAVGAVKGASCERSAGAGIVAFNEIPISTILIAKSSPSIQG
jgi:hypothetical protein